jgi:4-hydroxy-3-polyprenylbenzoate decarboxylase
MNNVPTSNGTEKRRKRIVVAMTGATGAILGIKLLIVLRRLNVETHLILSPWGEATIRYETDYTPANVRALADHVHSIHNQAAPISSGSFHADGMIVLPCSMKTLAAVNAGYCDDLISRAADVMMKERRRLVLAVRETPLSEIHLRNMLDVTRAGAIICPTVPAFYMKPGTIDDLVDQMVGRMLDLFDLDTGTAFRRKHERRKATGQDVAKSKSARVKRQNSVIWRCLIHVQGICVSSEDHFT